MKIRYNAARAQTYAWCIMHTVTHTADTPAHASNSPANGITYTEHPRSRSHVATLAAIYFQGDLLSGNLLSGAP